MGSGLRVIDRDKFVLGFASAVPSSASPTWVSLKYYNHITIHIFVVNATTVTGSAITLNQAKDVSGTSSKALAFTTYFQNLDMVASDTYTSQTASSNTFTTLSTNSKNAHYVLEVDSGDLDGANGFVTIQVGIGNATAATITAIYELSWPRYGGNFASLQSALLN